MAKFAKMQTQYIKLIVTALAIMVGFALFDGIAGDWFNNQLQIVGGDAISLTMLLLIKFVVILAAGALGFAAPLLAVFEQIKKIQSLIVSVSWVFVAASNVPPATSRASSSFRPPRPLS